MSLHVTAAKVSASLSSHPPSSAMTTFPLQTVIRRRVRWA